MAQNSNSPTGFTTLGVPHYNVPRDANGKERFFRGEWLELRLKQIEIQDRHLFLLSRNFEYDEAARKPHWRSMNTSWEIHKQHGVTRWPGIQVDTSNGEYRYRMRATKDFKILWAHAWGAEDERPPAEAQKLDREGRNLMAEIDTRLFRYSNVRLKKILGKGGQGLVAQYQLEGNDGQIHNVVAKINLRDTERHRGYLRAEKEYYRVRKDSSSHPNSQQACSPN